MLIGVFVGGEYVIGMFMCLDYFIWNSFVLGLVLCGVGFFILFGKGC